MWLVLFVGRLFWGRGAWYEVKMIIGNRLQLPGTWTCMTCFSVWVQCRSNRSKKNSLYAIKKLDTSVLLGQVFATLQRLVQRAKTFWNSNSNIPNKNIDDEIEVKKRTILGKGWGLSALVEWSRKPIWPERKSWYHRNLMSFLLWSDKGTMVT